MGSGASSKKQISCPVCTASNMSNDEFVQHYRKSHNKQCTKCGLAGFETEADMYAHYDEIHSNNNSRTSSISCRKCSLKFTDETEFIKHTNKEHGVIFNFSQISLAGREVFACPHCGKSKINPEKLQKHLLKNHSHICVKCDRNDFKSLTELKKHHAKEHPPLVIKCPIKCDKEFSVVDDFLQHLLEKHNFAFVAEKNNVNNNNHDDEITTTTNYLKCPKCEQTIADSDIVEHVNKEHSTLSTSESTVTTGRDGRNISCPKCNKSDDGDDERVNTTTKFTTSEDLLEHMRINHNFSSNTNLQKINKKKKKSVDNGSSSRRNSNQLPKVGDRVLAMWEVSMWQYFHATIQRKVEGDLAYEIDWDDGDTTGKGLYYWC